jgi:hypothetical protein
MRRYRKKTHNRREDEARTRAFRALSAMRRGASISRAAKENGVTPRTIKQYVGAALRQDRPGGRIRATKSDRLVRYLQIPGPHGPIEIRARGIRQAREFARYKIAVNRFLAGDRDALIPWHGKKIAGIALQTESDVLKNLAQKDLLPYPLYRSLSGGGAA